jgi:cadmium resistance protein CadD (predicted permease)
MSELWQDFSTGFSLALVAYAATNIDNFIALIGLSAKGPTARPLVFGFSMAATAILVLAVSFSLLSYFIEPGQLRYLGIVPIAIGIRLLLTANSASVSPVAMQMTATSVFAFLAVSSMDTVATFGPLLAESEPVVRASIVAGYLVMASAMLWGVLHVSRAANKLLENNKFVLLLAPLVMIAVGVYILLDTGTDLQYGP